MVARLLRVPLSSTKEQSGLFMGNPWQIKWFEYVAQTKTDETTTVHIF